MTAINKLDRHELLRFETTANDTIIMLTHLVEACDDDTELSQLKKMHTDMEELLDRLRHAFSDKASSAW